MIAKFWLKTAMLASSLLLIAGVHASYPTVPSETFEALGLDQGNTTPKQLYDALVKRYKDPEQGAGPADAARGDDRRGRRDRR